ATWGNAGVAKEIVKEHRDILKQKDLSYASIGEIGDFISAIARGDAGVAKEIVKEHRDILKQKLSDASIREREDFLERISEIDKKLAKEFEKSI
ncbi:MAG: hypothetical protein DRG27_02830, partial [Deltaproteobacteria bacterium]